MKNAVQIAGCVFVYFCGGSKSNFQLQFRSFFNTNNKIITKRKNRHSSVPPKTLALNIISPVLNINF